jgi:alcohol dehydrogenase
LLNTGIRKGVIQVHLSLNGIRSGFKIPDQIQMLPLYLAGRWRFEAGSNTLHKIKGGKEMKAVAYDGAGSVRILDVPKPVVEDTKDAIVQITHATICGSDLNILNGKIPVEENATLGHEGVGIVEDVGSDVKRFKKGDRVAVSYSVQCGECENCRNGLVVFCEYGGMFGHGTTWGGFGGSQAGYLQVPWADACLELIPEGVTEEQAMLVTDNLVTGYQACEFGSIAPGSVVAVFGAGPVGLCAMACARLFGPSFVVGVDLLDYRLEAAKKLGADAVINAGDMNPVEAIKELTDGKGADVCIEAVGSTDTLDACFESVRNAGNISVLGVFSFEKVGVNIRDMLRRNLQMRCGRANMIHMSRLLSLIKNGKLDMTSIISHRMPLEKAGEAYNLAVSRSENVLKIMLIP